VGFLNNSDSRASVTASKEIALPVHMEGALLAHCRSRQILIQTTSHAAVGPDSGRRDGSINQGVVKNATIPGKVLFTGRNHQDQTAASLDRYDTSGNRYPDELRKKLNREH